MTSEKLENLPVIKTVESIYCPSIARDTIIFIKRIEPVSYSPPSYELWYYCARVDECSDTNCLFRRYVRKDKEW